MTLTEEACAVIPATIKRMIACYLLAQVVPFTMEPAPENRYAIRVSPAISPGLQEEIKRVLQRGIVDDDDAMAWFRYQGALLSYMEWQPGYTAAYHYRYETAEMDAPKEFDIRDLETFSQGENHEAAIRRALDAGILHPNASFLQDAHYAFWERA